MKKDPVLIVFIRNWISYLGKSYNGFYFKIAKKYSSTFCHITFKNLDYKNFGYKNLLEYIQPQELELQDP